MPYVIAAACIDAMDTSCVEECPVDCIYEGDRKLYINPKECIDCGACEPVVPGRGDQPGPAGARGSARLRRRQRGASSSSRCPAATSRSACPAAPKARPHRRRHRTGHRLRGGLMLDGRPLIDAHVHAARLPTLKPAWREWAHDFGDQDVLTDGL